MPLEKGNAYLAEVLEWLLPASRELGGSLVWSEGGAIVVRKLGANSAAMRPLRETAFWWGRTAQYLADGNNLRVAYAAYRLGLSEATVREKLKRVLGGRKRAAGCKAEAAKLVAQVNAYHQQRDTAKDTAFHLIASERRKAGKSANAGTLRNQYYRHAKTSNNRKGR